MQKNYFISFEGIDGSGKDTQLHKLSEILRDDNEILGNKYCNIWITREPTKITKSGKLINELLKTNNLPKETAVKYFIEDRKEHSKIIKEIKKHSHVLVSRYDISTLLYQMTQGMDFETLWKEHKFEEENGCTTPDLSIIFDIDTKTAVERINKRNNEKEFFETLEFQKKLRENLFICIEKIKKINPERKIIIINANQSIEEVTNEMKIKVNKVLN